MSSAFYDVVRELENAFQEKGFVLQEANDYAAAWSASGFSVHLSTDRYYPASTSGYILMPSSHKYEMGLLHEIIDPKQRELDKNEALSARTNLELDSPRWDDGVTQKNLRLYRRTTLIRELQFLVANQDKIADPNEPYRDAYLKKSEESMARLGLVVRSSKPAISKG